MQSLSPEEIRQAFSQAKKSKPAYQELYPFLEPLFIAQSEIRCRLDLPPIELEPQVAKTKLEEGFPLVHRWDFPLDMDAAGGLLSNMKNYLPAENGPLKNAYSALIEAFERFPDHGKEIWESFMQHQWEPWSEWVQIEDVDEASLLFLARSCLQPSIVWSAERLVERFSIPDSWLKGYCPVCGSLPGILHLEGKGERRAHCSWCGTEWGMNRLQCPYCDNRQHEALGYLYAEEEPEYRAYYCHQCKMYFKLVDLRERSGPIFFPLEEWITLHLDLLAHREGWLTPPSPSPTVYGRLNE